MPLLDSVLDRLAAFEATTMPVLSLYLDTTPDQHGRADFESFLRKELKGVGTTFPLRSPERLSVEADTERIAAYLRDELRPSSNGLAIFACAGAAEFFEAVQLEAAFTQHQLHVADRPHLYPLARVSDQHPPYAALVADTNAARLFVFGRGVTMRSEEVQGTKVSRTSVGGWSQARYQRHVENFHLQHAKELVEALEQVIREDGVEQIVLAGDEVITPLLMKQLPKHLSDRIIDVLRLDITTPEHQILKATTDALRAHDGDSDADQVRRLFDQYRAGQLAVVGALATHTALSRGQVDVLLVSASPDAVHDDTASSAADPSSTDEPSDESVPITEQLVRLARTTGASVTFIEDASLLADAGGVGAMLRYRLQPSAPAAEPTVQEAR